MWPIEIKDSTNIVGVILIVTETNESYNPRKAQAVDNLSRMDTSTELYL